MKERLIRAFAGILILTGLTLYHFVNVNWIWLDVFVGFNLLQSSITKFCPLEKLLVFLKVK